MEKYNFLEEENRDYSLLIKKHLRKYIRQKTGQYGVGFSSEEELINEWKKISEKAEKSDVFLPVRYISKCVEASFRTMLTLMCAYFSAIDDEVAVLCMEIGKKRFLTVAQVQQIFYEDSYAMLWKERRQFRMLFNIDLEKLESIDMPVVPVKRIISLLAGGRISYNLPYSDNYLLTNEPEEYIGDKIYIDEMIATLSGSGKKAVILQGREGSGRRFLLKHGSRKMKKGILFIDWQRIKKNAEEEILNIALELRLQRTIPCIIHIPDKMDDEELIIVERLVDGLSDHTDIVCICEQKETPFEFLSIDMVHRIRIPDMEGKDRAKLWEHTAAELEENIDVVQLANLYKFTPGKIMQVIKECQAECEGREQKKITKEQISRQCAMLMQNMLKDKASLIDTKFTLEDLVIAESEKRQLIEGMNHIRYSDMVYDRWNFENKFAYGKSMTMLFCGPPGTGKTMAASIISRELGLPAFRVDISRIMSKYIGETEKNIGEIFDAAQEGSAILFFDETDALFGKRSEIRDSHDKYANIETSYLLQRIESYDGICIMTTNLLQNIDEAFLRRISYIVHFSLPETEERYSLWKNAFPNEAECDDTLDFGYLAEMFEISGAMIKNTVLQAAFLAAAEKEKIGMKHILRALAKQMSKHGKHLTEEELGVYKSLLQE